MQLMVMVVWLAPNRRDSKQPHPQVHSQLSSLPTSNNQNATLLKPARLGSSSLHL